MAGIRRLDCREFSEAATFDQSVTLLKNELAERGETITDQRIDARIEAMQWALNRGDLENLAPVGTRNLWVYVMPGGEPPMRCYLRPRSGVPDECELLWIEERLL